MKLDELGCFKNISIFIDTSKGPKATPDGLEVSSVFWVVFINQTYAKELPMTVNNHNKLFE